MDLFGFKKRAAAREKRKAQEELDRRILLAWYFPQPPSRETLMLQAQIRAEAARADAAFAHYLDALTKATPSRPS